MLCFLSFLLLAQFEIQSFSAVCLEVHILNTKVPFHTFNFTFTGNGTKHIETEIEEIEEFTYSYS